jgi:hypothetical protein
MAKEEGWVGIQVYIELKKFQVGAILAMQPHTPP